jgi:hypothetical protein
MSQNSQQFFKGPEDYERWDPYILECDFIEGLTTEDRQRAKQALKYLRKVLGRDFLKDALEQGHPLLPLFLNRAPWTRLKLIGLADALEKMRGAENFKTTLKRIKDVPPKGQEGEFAAGYSVLQMAYRFFRAGFRVRFVDDRRGSHRRPDLELFNDETGEEVFVEVSVLRIAAEVEKIQALNGYMFLHIGGIEATAQVTAYGEMLKSFDKSHADDVIMRIAQVAADVNESGELRELIDEYIAVGIAPRHKLEELNRWAAERGFEQNFAGAPINLSEMPRVQRKIRGKLEQLPKDKPGIIVIPNLSMFLFNFFDLSQIIGELERQATDSPNLLAIVLSQGYIDESLANITLEKSGPHIIINRVIAGCIEEPIIVVKNQAFAQSVSPSTLEKIAKAFS